MNTIIRKIRPEEHDLLREFLYQAIYLPKGVEPPPRSVVDWPELQVYIEGFGTRPGDHCLVAEVGGKVVGAAWCRIMEDYGHIDNDTPSLAISLLPEYRGLGVGTWLLNALLLLSGRMGTGGHPSPSRRKIRPCASTGGPDSAFWRRKVQNI